MRSQVRKVVGSIYEMVSPSPSTCSGGKTYLVELVKVPQDDDVVPELGEQLLAHLPPPLLLRLPGHVPLVRPICRLRVVTAEKGVTAEDDILRVDPVIRLGIDLVAKDISQAQVVSVWT